MAKVRLCPLYSRAPRPLTTSYNIMRHIKSGAPRYVISRIAIKHHEMAICGVAKLLGFAGAACGVPSVNKYPSRIVASRRRRPIIIVGIQANAHRNAAATAELTGIAASAARTALAWHHLVVSRNCRHEHGRDKQSIVLMRRESSGPRFLKRAYGSPISRHVTTITSCFRPTRK